MPPRFRLLAAIVAALLVAGAACSSGDETVVGGEDPATTTTPISPEVTHAEGQAPVVPLLAQVIISGGLCPDGPCRTEYAVHADGSWTKSDESGRSFDGRMIHEEKKRLHAAIAGVTLDDLVVGPFTGDCPTAVDGQARTYVLYPTAVPIDGLRVNEEPRSVTVDTCRDELRADAPAIVALDQLVASTSGG